MAVENSKEELPLAVADTQTELAVIMGVTLSHICRCVKGQKGFSKQSKFRVYQIDVNEIDIE